MPLTIGYGVFLYCSHSAVYVYLKVDSTESGLLFEIEPIAVAAMKPAFGKSPATDEYATELSEMGSLKHRA